MKREQLKELAEEIKSNTYDERSAMGYMQLIIAMQDTFIDELEKANLKRCIDISRISGLSKSLAEGLAWKEFNKEGAINVAKEILELADRFLERPNT